MNPLDLEKDTQNAGAEALKIDREAALRSAAMIQDFMNHPGWAWLKQKMAVSLRAWEEALDTSFPVGEGAAKMARAQGAKIAIKQMLLMPENTHSALARIAKGEPGEVPEV